MIELGFLGLGIMGTPMVKNLLKAGFPVTVWNRSPEKCEPLLQAGAKTAETPAEVVKQASITFTMVTDPEASKSVCFGKDGVLEAIGAGKGYIDVSTINPEMACTISDAITEKGGRFLEAPVSGSKKPAEDGSLVFICAGDKSLFDDAQPALDIMGKKSFYFEETGQAAQVKLIINMIMGTMMAAFAEGLALGSKAGIDLEGVLSVLQQGAIDNPMFRLKGPLMTDGNFSPAFPLKHMQKDLRLAALMGDTLHQPLSTAAAANNSFIRALEKGFGDDDFSAILKTTLS